MVYELTRKGYARTGRKRKEDYMKKDKHKTKVKFVNLEGKVLALFPNELYSPDLYGKTLIVSYMHIGQHGSASSKFMRRKSVSAEKYSSLKKELESLGYNLEVIE